MVPISLDGQVALGSGVLLTQDGYILTALHVVAEALEVKVQLPNSTGDPALAVVRDADALADVALLKVDLDRPLSLPHIRFVPVALPGSDYWENTAICVVGYELLNGAVKTFKPRDKRNFTMQTGTGGFLRFDGEVPEGFSGGGAFADGRLLGIVERSSRFGSRVLPVSHVWSFLSRAGLEVGIDGDVKTASVQTNLESLAKKLDNTSAKVDRILTSVSWHAQYAIPNGASGSDELVIHYEPIPAQRVEGQVSGTATPMFDTEDFKAFLAAHEPISFPIYGPIVDGRLHFPGTKYAIDHVIGKYAEQGVDVGWDDLHIVKLNFKIKTPETTDLMGPIDLEIDESLGHD